MWVGDGPYVHVSGERPFSVTGKVAPPHRWHRSLVSDPPPFSCGYPERLRSS